MNDHHAHPARNESHAGATGADDRRERRDCRLYRVLAHRDGVTYAAELGPSGTVAIDRDGVALASGTLDKAQLMLAGDLVPGPIRVELGRKLALALAG